MPAPKVDVKKTLPRIALFELFEQPPSRGWRGDGAGASVDCNYGFRGKELNDDSGKFSGKFDARFRHVSLRHLFLRDLNRQSAEQAPNGEGRGEEGSHWQGHRPHQQVAVVRPE